MEKGSEGFQILHNTADTQGLDAWRKLNHRFDPSNSISRLNQPRKLVKEQNVEGVAPNRASTSAFRTNTRVVRQHNELLVPLQNPLLQKVRQEFVGLLQPA